MRKYMKYEIKGSYKFILGIIAIVLIASSIIQGSLYKEKLALEGPESIGSGFQAFLVVISVLVIFGAFLTAFFHIVGSFRKELYEDRGYLTFTLPLSGNKILGGKMLVAMIYFMAIGLSIILYNLILAIILHGTGWIAEIRNLLAMVDKGVIASIIFSSGFVSILSSILTLVLIYFSIALSKVSVKNKKIGGLWFIIFLILNGIISYFSFKISELFPYFLNINNFKIAHIYDIFPMQGITSGMGQMLIYGGNFHGYINIIGNLFQVLVMVGGFLTTAYLIEKKIDL